MVRFIVDFGRDDSGATAIEYGLIAALIGVAVIASFIIIGDGLTDLFGHTESESSQVFQNAVVTLQQD